MPRTFPCWQTLAPQIETTRHIQQSMQGDSGEGSHGHPGQASEGRAFLADKWILQLLEVT